MITNAQNCNIEDGTSHTKEGRKRGEESYRKKNCTGEKIENERKGNSFERGFLQEKSTHPQGSENLLSFSGDIKAAKWDFGSIIAPRGEAKKAQRSIFQRLFGS